MKKNLCLLIFFFSVCTASALLPPDAALRTQEILRYRHRVIAEHEDYKKQRAEELVRRENEVDLVMSRSPWLDRSSGAGSAALAARQNSARTGAARRRTGGRWIVGICALLLIAGAVWWVHIMTGQQESELSSDFLIRGGN
jgi:hypothetical protein